tara:strand:- start:302 stop:916 length:615 start_codon:yes stop_codon:yes gene_type:complete
LTITEPGNVGIGTTGPESNAGYNALTISSTEGGQSYWKSTDHSVTGYAGADSYGGYIGTNTGHDLLFRTVNIDRAKIDTSGDFYTNDGSVSSLASDVRVKKNISDIEEGLEIVNKLRPVSFEYNGKDTFHNDDGRVYQGFIADEVKEVAPFYVTEGKGVIDGEEVEDFKTLSTTRMIPMMMKAIQELSAKNEELTTRIESLENS